MNLFTFVLILTFLPLPVLLLIACWLPSGHPNRAALVGAIVLGAGYAAIKWHAIEMYPNDFGGFKGLYLLAVPAMAGMLAAYAAVLGCSVNGLCALGQIGDTFSLRRVLSVVGLFLGVAVGIILGPGFAAWPGF